MTLQQEREAWLADRWELDRRVLAGEQDSPPCYTCKAPSTHVTTRITPAGYLAYQCAAHAVDDKNLWGSDPGWPSKYRPLAEARRR